MYRDIIFGSQMRTYEGNFQNIQRDIERLFHEIDRLNEKTDEHDRNHNQKLQALERELRKADDNLRAEIRETAFRLTDEKVDLSSGKLFNARSGKRSATWLVLWMFR